MTDKARRKYGKNNIKNKKQLLAVAFVMWEKQSIKGGLMKTTSDNVLEYSVKTLREMTAVQCSNGNWNYDPYMHGMANGMIFALSLFDGGEPKYLDAPKQWLKDKTDENFVLAKQTTI